MFRMLRYKPTGTRGAGGSPPARASLRRAGGDRVRYSSNTALPRQAMPGLTPTSTPALTNIP